METLSHPVRAFWWGVLHSIAMFEPAQVETGEIVSSDYRSWFGLGEVCMAGLLAGIIAIPAGCWFAGRTELPLAFIGMAVVFLPIFVFLPRLIRYATVADTEAVLEAFCKNEHIQSVFWTLFVAMAGLVLMQVLDPAAAREIVGILTGLIP